MACWVALSDTDGGNGGLCVVPGSHRDGLRATHLNEDDDHLSWETEHLMRAPDGREWKETFYSFQIDDLDEGAVTKLTVPKGAGVFFTGMTIHGSFANTSDRERLAFATHFIAADSWLFRADVQDALPVTELADTV
jgi:ectoine hydroxylase-related dioxygenase (phytanoyl-CoA dioxygenase family)